MTADFEGMLHDTLLMGEIVNCFYGQEDEDAEFILEKMLPHCFSYVSHDTFHPYVCFDTGWQLACCYHSVGECMELRDAAQTFRVVFRLKQELRQYHNIGTGGVETFDEWEHWFIIDRIDGREALGRYLMTWKLTQ